MRLNKQTLIIQRAVHYACGCRLRNWNKNLISLCQPLNNSFVLLQPHSSLRLLNCYLDYFIKHSFICGPLLPGTDFGSSFFKLMIWAMGVINSLNIINMINFQAEIYYIRISTMSTEMHHCQNKYHGKKWNALHTWSAGAQNKINLNCGGSKIIFSSEKEYCGSPSFGLKHTC